MRILYINNFRGFANTYVPIKEVNFFVGENSTGKSSVLSLLRLISTLQFWHDDDFNINDIELGFFDELISKNFIGKKEFQIGFNINEEMENQERPFKNLLATYKNEKGSPKLYKLKIFVGNTNISINVSDKKLRFHLKKVDYTINDLNSFKFWVNDEDFSGIKYKILNNEDDYSTRLSFYEIRKFLRTELPEEKQNLDGSPRPNFLPYTTWIAPIRTKPKRIYESVKLIFSPEGDHTPLLIKSILSNQFKENITREQFAKAIEAFGKQSGLFDKIAIENLGKHLSSPFILNIYLNGVPLKITNVGYGVGQVLPLLTEILVTHKGTWFSIQQPEVHLHPRAQAALGEFLYNAATLSEKCFLIETHSDFIIDRFRLCIKKGESHPSSQVLFFERKNSGNIVTAIEIDEEGQYSENQPKSFRDFFINEELNLLSL
jgi:predicted ATPase